jgi:Na+-translocating ferredoxin:NAD+ oxidoreductase subunit G
MKKIALCMALALCLMSFMQDTSAITKEEGMTVVNTTTICPEVKGYTANTPVKIYIKDGKIQQVKPLRNKETPKYFALVKKQMLGKFVGMTVKKAAKANVDAVTGATMSSKAILKNVQKGCQYYNKKK